MIKKLLVVGGAFALLSVGSTAIQAQDRAPGDVNVRALETPSDVRGKQIRAQNAEEGAVSSTAPKAVGEQGAAPSGPAAGSMSK